MRFPILFFTVLFLSLLSLGYATSSALLAPSDYYGNAPVIILGTIKSVDPIVSSVTFPSGDTHVYASKAVIVVEKSWKAYQSGEVSVYSPSTTPVDPEKAYYDLSFPFEEGKKVIIYGVFSADGFIQTQAGSGSVYAGAVNYADHLNFLYSKPQANASTTVEKEENEQADKGTIESTPEAMDEDDLADSESDKIESENETEMNESGSDMAPANGTIVSTTTGDPTPSVQPPVVTQEPRRGLIDQIVDFFARFFSFR